MQSPARYHAVLVLVAVIVAAAPAHALPDPRPSAGPGPDGIWQITEVKPGDASIAGLDREGAAGEWGVGRSWVRDNGQIVGQTPVVFSRSPNSPKWQQTPLKTAGTRNTLLDVEITGPGQAIAVGTYDAGFGGFLTAQPEGSPWTLSPAPAPKGIESGRLEAVDATSNGDAWAVGTVDYPLDSPTTSGPPQQPVVARWDGSTWQQSALPAPKPAWTGLDTVQAVAPDDVWAAGHAFADQPLLAHFDGGTWQYVDVPVDDGNSFATLNSVLARSANDIWALGFTQDETDFTERPLVLHFDGTTWAKAPTPTGEMRIMDAVLTTTGIAALTMDADGYAVSQLVGDTWTRRALPAPPASDMQLPTAIAYEHGRLTVAAVRWSQNAATDRTMLFTTLA